MTNQPLTPETLLSMRRVAEACGWEAELSPGSGAPAMWVGNGDRYTEYVASTKSLILFLHQVYPVLRERGLFFRFFNFTEWVNEEAVYEFLTDPIDQLRAAEEVLCEVQPSS